VAQVFAVMALSPQHSFQILTKRPGRLASMLSSERFQAALLQPAIEALLGARPELADGSTGPDAGSLAWPVPNVWVGTSIETDEYCWHTDELRRLPAATRFLSLEPLLGPLPSLDLAGIDWVIVGGESGPGFRPLDLDWVRDIRDRCVRLRIPVFFKQIGGRSPKAGGRLLDGRTWDEYPAAVARVMSVPGRHCWYPKVDLRRRIDSGCLFRLSAFAAQECQGEVKSFDLASPAFGDCTFPAGKQISLEFVEDDLLARRSRAEHEAWLGEVEGIDLTLTFLRQKREQTQRLARIAPADLGMPGIPPAAAHGPGRHMPADTKPLTLR